MDQNTGNREGKDNFFEIKKLQHFNLPPSECEFKLDIN